MYVDIPMLLTAACLGLVVGIEFILAYFIIREFLRSFKDITEESEDTDD